ncbi:MAG: hypothetical protein LBQ20_05880 [Rhodanobacter sp.]|nr:hypothetical protein [Rhodanobacter sp.]
MNPYPEVHTVSRRIHPEASDFDQLFLALQPSRGRLTLAGAGIESGQELGLCGHIATELLLLISRNTKDFPQGEPGVRVLYRLRGGNG